MRCIIQNCRDDRDACGLCAKHVDRLRTTGSLVLPITASASRPVRHGLSNTSEYNTYHMMKQRCYNPKHTYFRNYGGRGIKVCKEWRESFETFLRDMGPKPDPSYTLDRIDNDGDYEPTNCKWSDWQEQMENKRTTPDRHRYRRS